MRTALLLTVFFLASCTTGSRHSESATEPLPNLIYLPADLSVVNKFSMTENEKSWRIERSYTKKNSEIIITDHYTPPRNGIKTIIYTADTGGNVKSAGGKKIKTDELVTLSVSRYGDLYFSPFYFQMDIDDEGIKTMVSGYGQLTENGFRFSEEGSRRKGIIIGCISDASPPVYHFLFIDSNLPHEVRKEVWRRTDKEFLTIEAVF